MSGVRRSAPPRIAAPPDGLNSPTVPLTPAEAAARRTERRREAAAKRRRRRRRTLIAAPFAGLLIWLAASYTIFMLEPTSMTVGERSAEWVRQEVPFGNFIVDEVEHVYYTANAPKKGGPSPKHLPSVGS